MSLTATTLKALHDAIAARIEDLTPPSERSRPFVLVERKSDVPGGGFRNFYLEFSDFADPADGIHGEGMEMEAQLAVYMNYHGLDEYGEEALIWDDGHEIYLSLNRALDPTIAGLMGAFRPGSSWVDENEQRGSRWGAHLYTVRFFARGLLI